ncbi:DeoR/GlpR family DNA-binding transcription regulator [Actinopolyspora sp. H202]|uniref:DeoR/GlpR family DNA-binding transcription regulator n=1 Tax=Actinopolyspora sp. H202 TaxID=1500456 RepID=UPI003EE78CB4
MSRESRDRRAAIVRMATTSGLASVDELSNTFGVTASTIRRDLAQLESAGQLARTYGGAMPVGPGQEPSLCQRSGESFEAKHAIAGWAAGRIRPGETVLLDSGSTTGALARHLRGAHDITVVTTGLTVLQELADSQLHVECLGGTLRHVSQGFVGPLTEAALERMTFDRVFLGADGVTPDRGICEMDLQQTRLKELMAHRAEHVYVLVHAAKLDRRPFHSWARLPRRTTLVTDTEAEPSLVRAFEDNDIDVVVVAPEGNTR